MKIERVNGKTFSTLQNVNSGYVKKINDEEYVIIKSKEIKGKTYFRISEEDLANKYNGMSGINFMNDRRKTKSYEPYTKEISFEINDNNKGIKSIGPKDKLKNNGYLLSSGSIYGKKSHYIINEIDEKNQIDEKRKEYDILNKCKNVMEEDIECNRVMEEKLTSIIADINCMKGVFSKAVANMNFIPGMIDTPIKGVRLFRIFK